MTTIGAAVVPSSTYAIFPAGTPITGAQAGDLVLVRHKGVLPKLIRLGQAIRYRGKLRPYVWCNHSAIISSPGWLIEQGARGGVLSRTADYTAEDVAVVRIAMSSTDRAHVVAFAQWTLGIGYGYFSIAAIVWDLLTGFHLSGGSGLRLICSAAAARALEHGGAFIPDRAPETIMPADLARLFGVVIPGKTTTQKKGNTQ